MTGLDVGSILQTRVQTFSARRSPSYASTPATAPSSGPTRYTHWLVQVPETSAGPKLRAGFIDAPEAGPANITSSSTTNPIASAAAWPAARTSVATAVITNISRKVSRNSSTTA